MKKNNETKEQSTYSKVHKKDDYGNNYLMLLLSDNKEVSIEEVSALLTAGLKINHQNEDWETILYLALKAGKKELSTFLVEQWANLDMENEWENIVSLAVKTWSLDLVKILVNKGANIRYNNYVSYSPLYNALKLWYMDIFEFLIKNGASLNESNNFWYDLWDLVIWDFSCIEWSQEQIRFLIKAGIDINCQNGFGFTPIMIATLSGDIPSLKILIEAWTDINKRNLDWLTVLDVVKEAQNILANSKGVSLIPNLSNSIYRSIYMMSYRTLCKIEKILIKYGAK